MVVLAVEILDMQGDAAGLGEGLEPFLEQLGVHVAQLRLRKIHLPDQIGPVRAVERHPGQGLVHRHQGVAIAADAGPVAQGLGDGLADRDAGILGRVVIVDMQVARGAHGQVHQGMAGQLLEHVVEKADAGQDVVAAGAVEIHFDGNLGLFGLARDPRGARRPGDGLVHGALKDTGDGPKTGRIAALIPASSGKDHWTGDPARKRETAALRAKRGGGLSSGWPWRA